VGPRLARRAAVALLLVVAAACSATITPALRQDAQTAARIKTALVNDPALGVYPITVRVTGGVAELTGEVASEAQITQVVALARQVPGVGDVRPLLRVNPALTDPRALATAATAALPARYEEPIEPSTDNRLVAIGGSWRFSSPREAALDNGVSLGPNVRLGMGTGPGVSIGFGWFNTTLQGGSSPGQPLARLRIRPIMAGLGYTFRRDRLALSLSLVGGLAVNSLSLPERVNADAVALAIDNSFAWRPGASFWYDASDRIAFNVFTGYLVTRPTLKVLEQGETRTRPLRADTVVVSAGLVYKLF
jgi:hypothetical protein